MDDQRGRDRRNESTNLLRMLSDHENETKVVHPQSEIEEFIRVAEEDDVLDGILCSSSVLA